MCIHVHWKAYTRVLIVVLFLIASDKWQNWEINSAMEYCTAVRMNCRGDSHNVAWKKPENAQFNFIDIKSQSGQNEPMVLEIRKGFFFGLVWVMVSGYFSVKFVKLYT